MFPGRDSAVCHCLRLHAQIATAVAADEAEAASGPPLNIALFVNSSPTYCYSSGHIEATNTLANLAAERINDLGGVRGRPVQLTVYDNQNNLERAVKNIRTALDQTDLLAMIGLSNEDRAAKVFAAIEKIPNADQVPFIANVSVGGTFKKVQERLLDTAQPGA